MASHQQWRLIFQGRQTSTITITQGYGLPLDELPSMIGSTRIWLIMGVMALVGAGVSLWLWFATQQPGLKPIGIFLGCIGGFSTIIVLHNQLSIKSQASNSSTKALPAVLRLLIFGLVLILVIGVSAAFWITYLQVHSMLYPSRNQRYTVPEVHGIDLFEEVQFSASDGLLLEGWYMPTQNGAVVILVHGYGGNRSGMLADAALLNRVGFGALVYDTRNSGSSQGSITTFGATEFADVLGAVQFVSDQPSVDPDRIGLLGHSMGGAISILAAAQQPEIKAIVAQSTFASLEENMQTLIGLSPVPFAPLVSFWGKRASGFDLYDARPIDSIAKISPRPILLIHGQQDQLLPVENAYRLYEAARHPKDLMILPEAGHCCLLEIGGQAYAQKITSFFQDSLLK